VSDCEELVGVTNRRLLGLSSGQKAPQSTSQIVPA